MRVLQINKFFYEKGGTERYFFSLCRALQKRGHDVVHFSMRHGRNLHSDQSRYFVAESDYERRYNVGEWMPRAVSFIRSREAADNVRRLIDDVRPDVAHLHNIYHQITPSIIPVLTGAGIPVVMTLHDYKLICPNYSLFDGRAYCYRCRGGSFYQAPLTRCSGGSLSRSLLLATEAYWQRVTRVYDGVRAFIAPSRYIERMHAAAGIEPVRYLPAFIDDELLEDDTFRQDAAGEALPAMDGGGSGGADLPVPFVVYFGRLSPEKGVATLIRAIQRLDGVSLVICGDGPQRAELESLAGDNPRVRFLGHLERSQLLPVVRRAVCSVIPTESPENAPFTALESMALGVPLVVSRIGGLPEMAERCGGPAFTPGNADELADAIMGLWRDPARVRATGERGRVAIEQGFREAGHMDGLETIYRDCGGRN